jgi:DNA-binding NarL/FixJ family response regulator
LVSHLKKTIFAKRKSMIKVAIFEDSKHLRETLEIVLNYTDGFACTGAFPDCNYLVDDLRKSNPDVVLMDIEMPGMNGIEATEIIKKKFPDIQILIQTVFFDDNYIFDAICAGASGYILKSTPLTGYLDAVKEVFNGGSSMTPSIAKRMLELFKTNLQPTKITNEYQLTQQETKVLQLLVAGKSYKMIAAELIISFDTVKSHIRNMYAKLHVNSGTEAVSKAIRDKIV